MSNSLLFIIYVHHFPSQSALLNQQLNSVVVYPRFHLVSSKPFSFLLYVTIIRLAKEKKPEVSQSEK